MHDRRGVEQKRAPPPERLSTGKMDVRSFPAKLARMFSFFRDLHLHPAAFLPLVRRMEARALCHRTNEQFALTVNFSGVVGFWSTAIGRGVPAVCSVLERPIGV